MFLEQYVYPALIHRFYLLGGAALIALLVAFLRRDQAAFHVRWAIGMLAAIWLLPFLLNFGFGYTGWAVLGLAPVWLPILYAAHSLLRGRAPAPAAPAAAPAPSAAGPHAPPVAAGIAAPPATGAPSPAAAGGQPLRIRSVAEEHLYMDLHPCRCGEAGWRDLKHGIRSLEGDLVSYFEGPCARCGAARRFLFVVPREQAPLGAVGYGGPGPSAILDAGQFLSVSDRLAKSVPASTAGLPPESAAEARSRLAWAIAAMEEALKFIPAGADEVPASALTSQESQTLLRQLPGQFARFRLEARLGAYRDLLRKMEASSQP